jgi:ribonuclease HII
MKTDCESDVKDTLVVSTVKDTLVVSTVKDTLVVSTVKDTLVVSTVKDTLVVSTDKDTLVVKKTKKQQTNTLLNACYNKDVKVFEIGVDESGRGPLFGRVYTAAVILPKDDSFDFSKVKDSKKFHSKKKIAEAAEYIKNHALSWHVSYEDEKKIDEINILQATQSAMHKSILEVRNKFNKVLIEKEKVERTDYSYSLLIDGNYFNTLTIFNKVTNQIEHIPHTTIEGGDNKYASIAAASILAKVERDNYIDELCQQNPELIDLYGIDSNKGYGAKRHMDGIKEFGITIWHRRSFAPCKHYSV